MMISTKEAPRGHRGLSAARRNVGGWERGARLFFGLAATGAAAVVPLWLLPLALLIGIGGFVTSIGAYCPINRAVGRDSYHRSRL